MRWGRKKREEDLERELRSHLELEAQEQRENHLTPEEARYAAQRAFGNTSLVKEATRETWGFMWLAKLSQDLRYGCRMLKNNPGFAAMAILTAALGIADFQYAAWRDQAGIFDGIAAYSSRRFTITGDGDPWQLQAEAVTPGFLRTMGIAPLMGRDFSSGDAAPRGGQVALLSYALWMSRFGGDPSILSKQMTLDEKPYSMAGVLPRDFEFPENNRVGLLVAMSEPPAPQPNGAIYFYSVIARLKPGVAPNRAQADLALINQRLESAYPKKFGGSRVGAQTRVVGLHDRLVGNVRPALLVLSGAVALVLLIVCVNISNLLLARAIARQKEMAVRIALGAGRGRVLRQLLTEGMLLAAAGGAAGLALAFGGVRLLRAIAPAGVPHIADSHIGGAVLGFNTAIAVLSGILFGLAPLRGSSGIDPDAALKQTACSVTGSRRHRRLEDLLIVAETALALILLAGAGLLIRTFAGLTAISPGFHPDNVAVNYAAGEYFRAMGIPILEGRAIDSNDGAERPGVAVVNQALARRFFPGAAALGARIWLHSQIAELDKDLPPPEIETMRAKMASLAASQLFVMRLLALFAGIAVTLAATGVYSVMVYSVERRAHEVGIRLAFGARRLRIMGLILGRALRLSIAGAVIGTAGGLALTRYLKSLLYGVTPHDPATLAAGCALVVVVALGAAYLPARRAVEQDPIATLRAE